MGITHTKVTVIADDPNYDVGADEWNDDHVVTGLSANLPTLLVAASNATAKETDAADYVCDGTADEVQINAAITALGSGRVLLSSGTFTVAATVVVADNITLSGNGQVATTIAGVSGLTASVVTLGQYSALTDALVTVPTTVTSDGIVLDTTDHALMRNVSITGGSGSSPWLLSIRNSFRFRLDNLYVYAACNGVQIVNTDNIYSYGNALVSMVEVWTNTASRKCWQISGYSGGGSRTENLMVLDYISGLSSSGVGSTSLEIINSQNLVFDGADLEGCDTSLSMLGEEGAGGSFSRNIVFTGLYASGAMTFDASSFDSTFIGGRCYGVITEAVTDGRLRNRYIALLDSSGFPVDNPAFYAAPTVVFGTSASEGTSKYGMRSDATVVAFDATVPVTQAYGDAAAAGSAAVAARRDHVHGMPAGVNLFVGPVDPRVVQFSVAAFVAQRTYYTAFTVAYPITVSKVLFQVTVQSGNMDAGLYNASGTRLASCGAFTVPAAGIQTQAFSGAATVALVPGTKYFAGMVLDNTTARIYMSQSGISSALVSGGASGLNIEYAIDTAGATMPSSFSTSDTSAGGARIPAVWFLA